MRVFPKHHEDFNGKAKDSNTGALNDMAVNNEQFAKDITKAFQRFILCDWGDMCRDDINLNDNAVKSGQDRILAAYGTCEGSSTL